MCKNYCLAVSAASLFVCLKKMVNQEKISLIFATLCRNGPHSQNGDFLGELLS